MIDQDSERSHIKLKEALFDSLNIKSLLQPHLGEVVIIQ